MSDDNLFLDQYVRVLDGLPDGDPWSALEESGFLDLLRTEAEGGAALDLAGLFPLAVETGRRPASPPIIETMAARLVDPAAVNVADVEALAGRPLAAAIAAAQMVGAMETIERLTIDYTLQRQQFGREIGRFQAIQNLVAVMVEEICAARIAVQAAFIGAPAAMSEQRAGLAKTRAGIAASQVSSAAHAVHGAIGVSEEYVLHHHTRRLRMWQMAHGGEGFWARQLGEWAIASGRDVTTLGREIAA